MLTVEMTTRKTVAVLALVLVAALMVSALPALAWTSTSKAQATQAKGKGMNAGSQAIQAKAMTAVRNGLQAHMRIGNQGAFDISVLEDADELSLDEVEDVDIDALIAEYEAIPEEERTPAPGVWIVVARGLSWERSDLPEVSEAAPEGLRVGLRMVVKGIWSTPEWNLYKVMKGVVGQNGTRYQVEGYALYKKETGKFYLSLEGEGISYFGAVGKVLPPCEECGRPRALRIVMKGRMNVEGENYAFAMRGRAFRPRIRRVKPAPEPEEQLTGTSA
jgi:hypothetical protein